MENRVIRSVNEIYDNLWLGDIKEVNKILNQLLKETDREKFISILNEALDIYKSVSSELKGKYKGIEHYKLLADIFKERIKERKINMEDAVIGSILEYFEKLHARLQNVPELRKIINRELYKYSILDHMKPKYEVRVLLKREIKEMNIEKLKELLGNMGFQLIEVAKTRNYLYLMAFSIQSYIEISVFIPRITIMLSLLLPEEHKIRVICEKIVNSLIG